MAAITITTNKEALQTIFKRVDRVYYFSDTTKTFANQSGGIELPVLEGGVTFETGEADKTEVKLTDGTIWVSDVTKGDSDVSFQVSSVSQTVNELFLEKNGNTITGEFDDMTYVMQGYSSSPKKVSGALLLTSKDKSTLVYLPKVEMYASFNGEGGDDSTGYYNVVVTPLKDATGNDLYFPNSATPVS